MTSPRHMPHSAKRWNCSSAARSATRIGGRSWPPCATAWGTRCGQCGEFDAAVTPFQQVEADLTPIGDPTSGRPEDLRLWGHAAWGLGRIACSRQEYDEGEAHYERAVQRFEASAYAYPAT